MLNPFDSTKRFIPAHKQSEIQDWINDSHGQSQPAQQEDTHREELASA